MTYADGRIIKHPRAANFAWKCTNGKYLYWFHNHGNKNQYGEEGYCNRNPVWLCGGVEIDSPQGKIIAWSQPEIVIYADAPFVRMSYPDLIEDDGKYYLSETHKTIARVHEIPVDFVNRIWESLEIDLGFKTLPDEFKNTDLLVEVENKKNIKAPTLPEFYSRNNMTPGQCGFASGDGFSLELIIMLDQLEVTTLINGRCPDGRGLALNIAQDGCLELIIDDGCKEQRIKSEPCINKWEPQHIMVNIDGGPRIISFVVNGRFCDGGKYRQFGWSRLSPYFQHVNWRENWELNKSLKQLKIYNYAFSTAECVNSFNNFYHKKI